MYSVVTPNRNRLSTLVEVLPSWQAAPLVGEIVIVDFGSEMPIRLADFADARKLKIVRVSNTDEWRIGLAINIGVDHAASGLICKLDSDIEIKRPSWLAEIDPAEAFYRGNFRAGVSNGQVIFAKQHWAAVGGYNEWLAGYGFDDSDFYIRLRRSGVTQRYIDAGVVAERTHSHEMRAGTKLSGEFFEVDLPDPKARLLFTSSRNTYLAYLCKWSAGERMGYTTRPPDDDQTAAVDLHGFSEAYRRTKAFADFLAVVRLWGDQRTVDLQGSMMAKFLSEDGGL